MHTTIPAELGEVTPGWLEQELRANGVITGETQVVDVAFEELGEGVGLLGDLSRASLTYDPQGCGPASLIVKVPTAAETNRQRGMAFGFYEREAHFYRTIGNTGRTGGLRVPWCFASPMDADEGRFVLVLEDLAATFRMADQIVGLQIDEARIALEALGRFHAAWWEDPELDELHWLPPGNGPTTKQAGPLFRRCWPLFVERFGDVVPDGGLELGQRVGDAFEALLDAIADEHPTMAHTDFRLDNLFFETEAADAAVAVIDWQLMTVAKGAYDVAYLLGQSMEREQRARSERELLVAWHDTLRAHGVDDYRFDEAWDDYRRSALVNLVIPVTAGADMDLGNERGLELVTTLTDRAFGAAVELDAGRMLPG
jgi:aminoglycoside/choline kinase family phosphotransferase